MTTPITTVLPLSFLFFICDRMLVKRLRKLNLSTRLRGMGTRHSNTTSVPESCQVEEKSAINKFPFLTLFLFFLSLVRANFL
jgi:hypothetical protein